MVVVISSLTRTISDLRYIEIISVELHSEVCWRYLKPCLSKSEAWELSFKKTKQDSQTSAGFFYDETYFDLVSIRSKNCANLYPPLLRTFCYHGCDNGRKHFYILLIGN